MVYVALASALVSQPLSDATALMVWLASTTTVPVAQLTEGPFTLGVEPFVV
jgi:hypothetical protein